MRAMTGCGCVGIEFGAVRTLHAVDVAGELDDGELHAETDAQIRHLFSRA